MPKYQDIYPSAPLLQSVDLVRPLAADLLTLEYFELADFPLIQSQPVLIRMLKLIRKIEEIYHRSDRRSADNDTCRYRL